MPRYEHSGGAQVTNLNGPISAGDVTIGIDSATGWPDQNFFVVIDRGTNVEEKILVGNRSGTTLEQCQRGADGTTAFPHADVAIIEHTFSAVEADAANEHTEATTGVHGLDPGVAVASQNDVFDLANQLTSLDGQVTSDLATVNANIANLQTELANLRARVDILEGSAPGGGDTTGLVDPQAVSRIGMHCQKTRSNFTISSSFEYINLGSTLVETPASGGLGFTNASNGGIKVPINGVYKFDLRFRVEGSSTYDERLEIGVVQGADQTGFSPATTFVQFLKRRGDNPAGTGSYEDTISGRLSYMDAGDIVVPRLRIISGRSGVTFSFMQLGVAYVGPGGEPVTQ